MLLYNDDCSDDVDDDNDDDDDDEDDLNWRASKQILTCCCGNRDGWTHIFAYVFTIYLSR